MLRRASTESKSTYGTFTCILIQNFNISLPCSSKESIMTQPLKYEKGILNKSEPTVYHDSVLFDRRWRKCGGKDTNSSLDGLSGVLMDEKVVSNKNNASTGQTKIDTQETAVLVRQTPNESPESTANTFWTGITGVSMEEDTTSRTATNVIEVVSQPPVVPPSQEAGCTMAEPELKTEYIVACGVILISAMGIFSLLFGLPGNKKAALTHKTLFKAYTVLTIASFISAFGLLVLHKIRPIIRGLAKIIKFTTWVALELETYAVSCATCILLDTSLITLILVLLVPLVFPVLVLSLLYVKR
ncbi:hypothetical protein HHK36_019501 [Tetracentron sinense]|uniref:Uncharacterized protein n=1 Tax=Tetracentron sinense TaxID=13715 RepID=A0A835D976_TETSI|nr:hypothetical protein HHK36_019501 [Tetracentron sinense]